jgi:hypothetical protein
MGPDCTACHSTAGWTRIAAGAFDHSRTRYPLAGKHAGLACAKCHRPSVPLAPLPHAACTDCHADAHAGRLASRSDKGACETCHSVEGFAPPRFGPAEHAATRFRLEGAHRAVACVVCHDPAHGRVRAGKAKAPVEPKLATGTSPFEFRFTSQTCAACHADPHAGQFATAAAARGIEAGRVNGTDCARCHGLSMWRIADFDHSKTRFPLDGAHRRAGCQACHRPMTIGGRPVIRYRPLEIACRSCHAEPVRQQAR